MNNLDQNFWDERYRTGQTGWDIGYVSPPLKTYFDNLTDKNLRVLIPGGGNSYEAAYLLEQGFKDVTVVDISAIVCQQLVDKYASQGLKVSCQDFFDHLGSYDLVVEQTFFCALNPSLRINYVQKMSKLLSPVGKLMGLFFNRQFEGGPPFGGNKGEYQLLFEQANYTITFDLHPNSVPPRKGAEVFFVATKK